jgi:mono/diheme cytochrome c family protein
MNNNSTVRRNRLPILWIVIFAWLVLGIAKSLDPAPLVFREPMAAPAVSAPAATPVEDAAPVVAAAPVVQTSAGDAEQGKALYATTCAACHGPNAEGVKGLGKDMTTSQFIADLSDADLLTFIKTGRGVDDPLNTTGVAMPPKGGNPAISDEQLTDIISFMRSIHK